MSERENYYAAIPITRVSHSKISCPLVGNVGHAFLINSTTVRSSEISFQLYFDSTKLYCTSEIGA